jgi:predicted nuclease with TOPRIM domain
MSKQKLDNGYQAVAFEVGKSLENAEVRIRELEALNSRLREDALFRMRESVDVDARIRELEAQLAAQNIRANERVADALKDRADMVDRAVKAEAQLAEARGDMQCLRQELGRLRAAIGPQHCDIHARFSAGCLNCRLAQAEARAEALRKALEMVEWVSTAGCDHSMLECPWCDELEYPSQRHADDCARQAALAPTPAEPPQVFPWKAGDMLRAELEEKK